ncbi:MAG: tRNA adenosine(34) deaminase TadA [Myxococcota bacterium]
MESWEPWMREAIRESQVAASVGDVPVGAVVVHDGQVLARGHNRREANQDPTWHAEIEALRAAAKALGRWRLTGCTLVVTLEPCAMCAYACVLSRVDRVVWGAPDPRFGAGGSLHNILGHPAHNHRPDVVCGVLSDEISAELKAFFRARR